MYIVAVRKFRLREALIDLEGPTYSDRTTLTSTPLVKKRRGRLFPLFPGKTAATPPHSYWGAFTLFVKAMYIVAVRKFRLREALIDLEGPTYSDRTTLTSTPLVKKRRGRLFPLFPGKTAATPPHSYWGIFTLSVKIIEVII